MAINVEIRLQGGFLCQPAGPNKKQCLSPMYATVQTGLDLAVTVSMSFQFTALDLKRGVFPAFFLTVVPLCHLASY